MSRCAMLLAAGLLLVLAGAAMGQSNLVTVEVDGEGMDRQAAINDGMRKAVEQAAGTLIYSQSQTRDFELMRDTILARAAGFVQSHEVLSTSRSPDGAVMVRLRCVVSRQGIEDTWGVVQSFLSQLGRPKIMVMITEKVDEVTGTVQAGQVVGHDSLKQIVQDDSTVQTRIENLLLENGFELVSREQIESINRRDLEAAMVDDDPAKVQAIAKRFGAQLFIKGTAHAAVGLPSDIRGVLFYTYEAQANIRCYRTDTGQLMSSQNAPLPAPRGVQRVWRSAADQALSNLGDRIAPAVRNDILRFWLDVTTGGGEVKLEVAGVSFREVVQLKRAIEELKDIKEVNHEFANGIATYSIQTVVQAKSLAEMLIDVELNAKMLDITDVTANVIKAKLE